MAELLRGEEPGQPWFSRAGLLGSTAVDQACELSQTFTRLGRAEVVAGVAMHALSLTVSPSQAQAQAAWFPPFSTVSVDLPLLFPPFALAACMCCTLFVHHCCPCPRGLLSCPDLQVSSRRLAGESDAEWAKRQEAARAEINQRLLVFIHGSLQALTAIGLLQLYPFKPRTVGLLGTLASALNCYFLLPPFPKRKPALEAANGTEGKLVAKVA